MKIHQLLSGVDIAVTNEERQFIETHNRSMPLTSLSEHDLWIAQNLVRKGVYKVTDNDKNITLYRNYARK